MRDELTDGRILDVMHSARQELKAWRLIEYPHQSHFIAVRDCEPTQSRSEGPSNFTIERHDFSDLGEARKFIEFRAFKAALLAYNRGDL